MKLKDTLMSKITFRADDDLVSRLEALDASKSEVMREALRDYLDRTERETTQSKPEAGPTTIDELVTDRLDALLDERESQLSQPTHTPAVAARPDITVNVSLEGTTAEDVSVDHESDTQRRKTHPDTEPAVAARSSSADCSQCGETLDDKHVYCPNCGNKASRRLFCECGDEIQSDWSFCSSCGRRTPSADVLDTP